MDCVKKHFQDEAKSFDARVVKSLPYYHEMLEALVSALPFQQNEIKKIVDLGCGTGTISQKLKEHFPNARITCVDFSENMVAIARTKLERYADMNYVISDVRAFDFTGYDAVVTSLTLHHLRQGTQKLKLYRKMYAGLNKKGAVSFADLVLGETGDLQRLNLAKWKEFLSRHLCEKDIQERYGRYKNEDRPFKLSQELAWLKKAGFKNLDVIWKNYHFAVFCGRK